MNDTLRLLNEQVINMKYHITHEEVNDYMLNTKILEGIF